MWKIYVGHCYIASIGAIGLGGDNEVQAIYQSEVYLVTQTTEMDAKLCLLSTKKREGKKEKEAAGWQKPMYTSTKQVVF